MEYDREHVLYEDRETSSSFLSGTSISFRAVSNSLCGYKSVISFLWPHGEEAELSVK